MPAPTFLDRLARAFGLAAEPTAEPPPLPAPASIDEADLARIPPASRERILLIRTLIADLRDRAEAEGIVRAELIELRQIETVHLPRLIESYAEIPPEHRAEIFRATGRSASFQLTEGLDRIVERLREISRQLAQGNLDAFAQNMRFIDERYRAKGPFD